MRILREDVASDLKFNNLSDLFTYYVDLINEQKQNNSNDSFNINNDKDKFEWIKRKVQELKKFDKLENIIVQLFSNFESEAIHYLNDISFNINGAQENIEYVIDKILSDDIDLNNKELYKFITTCDDLYKNSAQDFNYIFFIGQVFSDKSKLKKYFNEVNDLSIDSLFNSTNNLKSASEIYNMVEELTEQRGKERDNKDKSKNHITIEEFMKANNISGNHSNMLKNLSILIQKNWNSLNKKFGSFDIYKTTIDSLIDSINGSVKNLYGNKIIDELFSKKFANDGTIVTFLQDFIHSIDDYITDNTSSSKS